jgi:putative toxin-antitoxin system antitoxin component (TIGR02293 family)
MPQLAKVTRPKPFLAKLRLDLPSIESGVPLAIMADFVASSGLPLKDVYEVVIPARTLKHRRARREPLSRDESDKLARLVRVFDHAVRVFAETDRARAWLEEPKRRLRNFSARSNTACSHSRGPLAPYAVFGARW